MSIRVILWDWNGTLLDDLGVSVRLLNTLLAENGYRQQYRVTEYQEIFGFPIEEYYKKAGFDFERHPYPVLARRYVQLYDAAARDCTLTLGARNLLGALQRAGLRQVVLSASPAELLRKQVEERDARGFFDELLGLSDIYAKSKVQLGLDWLRAQNIDPKTALMVGDTVHDAEVAAAMGVRCVLYAGGHQSPQRLRATGCPVVGSMRELPGEIFRE